jgi:hypothetical protein
MLTGIHPPPPTFATKSAQSGRPASGDLGEKDDKFLDRCSWFIQRGFTPAQSRAFVAGI